MSPTTTSPSNPYIHLLPLHESITYHSPAIMTSPLPEFDQPISSTPPKLSLFSLPSKPSTLPGGLTPPPTTVATVPFLWEEVPGKPRLIDDPPKSKTVRSLDLPPRLTGGTTPCNNGNGKVGIEIIPSPTTVLRGPYEVIYTSKSILRSPENVVVNGNSNSNSNSKAKIRTPLRKLMRKERSPTKFSSWRWGSFRDIDGGRVDRSPSVRFCSWRWDSFEDMGGGNDSEKGGGALCSSFDDLRKSLDSECKIGKVSRKHSFAFGRATTSAFLTSMYGTLKQAMPWKSRRR